MTLSQLRSQLTELKKKETVAQTREALLVEEKQKLLGEMDSLLKLVRELGVVSDEELTPSNLSNVAVKLQAYIDSELSKGSIPPELM